MAYFFDYPVAYIKIKLKNMINIIQMVYQNIDIEIKTNNDYLKYDFRFKHVIPVDAKWPSC